MSDTDWLVYDKNSHEVMGLGQSCADARMDALQRTSLGPSDFQEGAESWAEINLDADADEFPCPDWATATQERFRESLANAQEE